MVCNLVPSGYKAGLAKTVAGTWWRKIKPCLYEKPFSIVLSEDSQLKYAGSDMQLNDVANMQNLCEDCIRYHMVKGWYKQEYVNVMPRLW
jgi:hypothetical protein